MSAGAVQSDAELGRYTGTGVGTSRYLAEGNCAVRSFHAEIARVELEVRRMRLQQPAGEALAFSDDLVGGEAQRGAARVHAALGVGAATVEHLVRVALHEPDLLERYTEPLGRHLGKRSLVPLPGRERAHVQCQRSVGGHAHLHALGLAAGTLAMHRETDAAAPAAPLALLPALREALPVR